MQLQMPNDVVCGCRRKTANRDPNFRDYSYCCVFDVHELADEEQEEKYCANEWKKGYFTTTVQYQKQPA